MILGIIVVATLLLMGMPFGRDNRKETTRAAPSPAVVEESPPATDTIVEIQEAVPTDDVAMQPNVVPNVLPNVMPTVAPPAGNPPLTGATPSTAASDAAFTPRAGETQPPTSSKTLDRNASGELTAAAATATLLQYVRGRNYYGLDPECIRAVNLGYKNAGYSLEVWRDCGEERRLDRWRVDSKQGEIFRQREDGRYLPP